MNLAYLTDVEGQWEKLASFCERSPLVALEGDELRLAEGARFVFGGDAIDRGPDARRVVACLTRARERYPDRVVLLAGNRDLNKLRLVRELSGHPHERTPDDLKSAPRAELLKWILARTMGAAEAFEHRRAELDAGAGDEVVVQSFLDDLAPGGALTRYLRLCTLCFRHGATLFVHGGLGEASLGHVPGRPRPIDDADAWIASLNAWYGSQMDAFVARACERGGEAAWQPLIAYQQPSPGQRFNPGSVVYGRLANDDNDPFLVHSPVIRRLRAAGIRRLVVGHTPSGDTPSVLRDPSMSFEQIMADNSYSRSRTGSRVRLDDDAVEVEGSVVLDDERRCEISFVLRAGEPSPIGLRLGENGPLVKGPMGGGEHLTFRYAPRYVLEQRSVGDAELSRQPWTVPHAPRQGL
ncbi:MAG: hypothetical protein IT378_00060 [Sandaracinaceae bacterium]|nr:hypothetical protein [Sandaracinaceae bacterium]